MSLEHEALTERIIGGAIEVHRRLGPGFLEKVYENALVHRLRKLGLSVQQQHPINVYDEDGTPIGEYYADLVLDGRLIIELKAAREIADEHVAQILGYLKSCRLEHGLLINFGSHKFQIKKYILNELRGRSRTTNLASILWFAVAGFVFFR